MEFRLRKEQGGTGWGKAKEREMGTQDRKHQIHQREGSGLQECIMSPVTGQKEFVKSQERSSDIDPHMFAV